jgi:NADP-dependent 3-hydroxy acid dehydrogenase YdfG
MMFNFLLITVCVLLLHSAVAKVVNGKWVVEELPTTVLITGCSSGIGRSTALEFAKDPKFKVFATMRDTSAWKGMKLPDNLILAQLDVTSDEVLHE